LVNLSAAEGHPASVMDMSFATQALAAEWACKRSNNGGLEVTVHQLPEAIEDHVATLKMASMGIKIDRLTSDQKTYLSSWTVGT
jgi:adenosylhomocysteinase